MVAPAVTASYTRAQARGRAIAAVCRVEISRVPSTIVAVVALAGGWGAVEIAAGVVLVVAACAIACALNDLADVESDTVNGRTDRPLVSGLASRRDVHLVVAGGTAAIVLVQPALPQPQAMVVTAAGALLAHASACRPLELQRRGTGGLIALASCYFLLPIALVTGPGALAGLAPLALVGAGVLAHKDVRDEAGDRVAGKSTLVVRYGASGMAWRAAALGAAGSALLVVTQDPGAWIIAAATVVAALLRLATRGPDLRVWLLARVALLALAIALAIS